MWILLFEAGRLFFLFVTRKEADVAGFDQGWGTLWHGLRMDMSMAAYITLPVILFLLAGCFIRAMNNVLIFKTYTILIFVLALLVYVVDAQSFRFWGHRLHFSALEFLQSPKEAAASVAHFPLIKWAVLFTAAIWIGVKLIHAFLNRHLPFQHQDKRLFTFLILLLLLPLSILPLRGGWQLAPINQSSVYFSTNGYANQAALNPMWNFAFSIKRSREVTENPYIVMPETEAEKVVKDLFKSTPQLPDTARSRKNVILLIWESFTAKVVDTSYNGIEITPNFNRLKTEGIWFSNAYATGDRTDKGIVGILSGYPAQPISSIVKNPDKSRTLPHLATAFSREGYHTAFYYGGEMEFANIKSYLMQGAFRELVDVNAFRKADRNSKWGAHDGVVMERFKLALQTMPQPFFANWLTLSSHEPYETPVNRVIKGKGDEAAFLNSMHYTDMVVGEFVDFCKGQPWWNKTLLVIVADHGHRFPLSASQFSNFHIPLLVLGGSVTPQVYSAVAEQNGLPATLLWWNGITDTSFSYSRNWFADAQPRAYFSFNNGFGYLKNGEGIVFDNISQNVVDSMGPYAPSTLVEGRALQQYYFSDFLKR